MTTEHPGTRYIGPCGNEREPDGDVCPGELYAEPGQVQVQCSTCDAWTGVQAPGRANHVAAWKPDTTTRQAGCTATDLLTALTDLVAAYPDARLVRNQVGNLTVMHDGHPAGWIDLTNGHYEP